MKSEITTLTEVNRNLIAENARLSKLYRQEQLKSLACMDLVSLQQDLGSVTEASIKQQKSEIEMIQKLCDGTPWGKILWAPNDPNSAEWNIEYLINELKQLEFDKKEYDIRT